MFSDTRTGLVLLGGHLATVAAALLLCLVHVAIGTRARRLLGAEGPDGAAWRWPVDAALGGSLLALVLLGLGALGGLRPVVVLAATASLAGAAWRELRAAALELPRFLTARRLPLAALLLLLVAAAVAPPTEWDSVMYHLRIPLWLLQQGRLGVPPDSLHVSLVGGAHFATLPLLAAGLRSGPAVMQAFALALVAAGALALGRGRLASRTAGGLAVSIVLGTPVFALVAITARVDVTLTLALLAAHLALEAWVERPAPGLLAVAALLLGGAVGVKPLAGAYALALLPLAWRTLRAPRPALAAVLLGLAASLPWLLKNQLLLGAPFAPFGAANRLEPWLAAVFGSPLAAHGMDTSILRVLPEARDAFSLLSAFFDPGRLTIEGEGMFYALSPVLLLLPLAGLTARSRARALPPLVVGILYALLVIVPFRQINLRYLMPAIPPLAVGLAAGLETLAEGLSVKTRGTILGVLLLGALWPLRGALECRLLAGEPVLLKHALGLASAQDVWRRHPDETVRAYAPVIENVHRLVPREGRVLMLWEARGLPIERDALVDVRLSNWSFLAQSASPARSLARAGITHVLVNTGALRVYISRGGRAEAFRLVPFQAFQEASLKDFTVVGPGHGLFTVKQAAP